MYPAVEKIIFIIKNKMVKLINIIPQSAKTYYPSKKDLDIFIWQVLCDICQTTKEIVSMKKLMLGLEKNKLEISSEQNTQKEKRRKEKNTKGDFKNSQEKRKKEK
jgi:hypothetical protein